MATSPIRIPKTLMILEMLLCLYYRSKTESEIDASEMLSFRSGAGLDRLSLQLTFIINFIIFFYFSQKIVSYRSRTCAGKPI
jgi:hypothetical protein